MVICLALGILFGGIAVPRAAFAQGASPSSTPSPDTPEDAKRKGDDASGADRVAWLFHALAVDPNVTRLDNRLGQGSALRQPDAVKETVDPQRWSWLLRGGAMLCEGGFGQEKDDGRADRLGSRGRRQGIAP